MLHGIAGTFKRLPRQELLTFTQDVEKHSQKTLSELRSDNAVFAHSTSFVHEEVLRLVQIV